MSPVEISAELETLKILADTREQPTQLFKDRLNSTGYPWERQKLDFGDYSVETANYSLKNKVAIERKMNLDELAMCFGSQRKRFQAEFERAKEAGATIYLLVENCSWDVLLNESSFKMRCKTRLPRKSIVASLTAWMPRYNMKIIFCGSNSTGQMIGEILYREMKEWLQNGE